jgi:hypothetical protein
MYLCIPAIAGGRELARAVVKGVFRADVSRTKIPEVFALDVYVYFLKFTLWERVTNRLPPNTLGRVTVNWRPLSLG